MFVLISPFLSFIAAHLMIHSLNLTSGKRDFGSHRFRTIRMFVSRLPREQRGMQEEDWAEQDLFLDFLWDFFLDLMSTSSGMFNFSVSFDYVEDYLPGLSLDHGPFQESAD
jgi:hypothetical protein